VDEALEIAKQIAEALEEAHNNGIIHRDLKPANVKLTPDGKAKVLDFGLAKAYEGDPASGGSSMDLSQSPTLARTGTLAGVILGTAAYMSPEQASGKAVDKRADIWSFGVVLFEMLTAQRPFSGDTVTEILASVLRGDPPWDALPSDCPPALTKLLRRCLKKQSRERLHDIGDARLELEDLQQGGAEGPDANGNVAAATERRHRTRERWLWTAALVVTAGVAAVLAVLHLSRETPEAGPVAHFILDTPDDLNLGARIGGFMPVPAVSPDGRHVAFAALRGGASQIWIRSLDSPGTRALPGTASASHPFWSPDGRTIAFSAGGELKKVAIDSGTVQEICTLPFSLLRAGIAFRGGTWNDTGTIVFSSGVQLYAVPETGGDARTLTTLDESRGESGHWWPQFLPNGRDFLFVIVSSQGPSQGLHVASLDARGGRRRLMPGVDRTSYSSGHLLFQRDRVLFAQPFDAGWLEASGDPIPVVESATSFLPAVDNVTSASSTWFGVSPNGVLVYLGFGASDLQLTWVDRKGDRLETLGETAVYNQIGLSPDGRHVAMEIWDENGIDLWVMDVSRGVPSRVTSDAGHEGDFVWSPDGQELIYHGDTPGPGSNLYRRGLRAGAPAAPLRDFPMTAYPESWSSDGSTLLYIQDGAVWALPLANDDPPELVLETEFLLDEAQLSPDRRWLAYISNESGDWEVYIEPFRRPGESVRVSVNGGGQPKWRGDGRELYFTSPSNMMMAVEVRDEGSRLIMGLPTELFEIPVVQRQQVDDYAVSPDGQRFLVKTPVEASRDQELHAVVNWPRLLED
jgi:Tol biopolymer transport system component